MAILSDKDIRALCCRELDPFPMLTPFSPGVQSGGVISYGLSHAGYDLRLGYSLLVFKNTTNDILNPKKFRDPEYLKRVFDEVHPRLIEGELNAYVIPPHGYALGVSVEHISMPRNIKGRCVGKSTLARSAILINTTPLEPGWRGHLTIEISNVSCCPAMVFAGEGIAQLEFETLSSPPDLDYEQKSGKYQDQAQVPVPSRVKE